MQSNSNSLQEAHQTQNCHSFYKKKNQNKKILRLLVILKYAYAYFFGKQKYEYFLTVCIKYDKLYFAQKNFLVGNSNLPLKCRPTAM